MNPWITIRSERGFYGQRRWRLLVQLHLHYKQTTLPHPFIYTAVHIIRNQLPQRETNRSCNWMKGQRIGSINLPSLAGRTLHYSSGKWIIQIHSWGSETPSRDDVVVPQIITLRLISIPSSISDPSNRNASFHLSSPVPPGDSSSCAFVLHSLQEMVAGNRWAGIMLWHWSVQTSE